MMLSGFLFRALRSVFAVRSSGAYMKTNLDGLLADDKAAADALREKLYNF